MGKEYQRAAIVKSTTEIPVTPMYANDFRTAFDFAHQSGSGGGAANWIVCRDPLNHVTGGHSLNLRTRASGAAVADFVYTRFATPSLNTRRNNYLFVMRPDPDTVKGVEYEFDFYISEEETGTIRIFRFKLIGTVALWELQVEDDTGWHKITDIMDIDSDAWLPIEAQIDNQTNMWEFIRIGNWLIDVSAYGPQNAVADTSVLNRVQIMLTARVDEPAEAWFDMIIVKGVDT